MNNAAHAGRLTGYSTEPETPPPQSLHGRVNVLADNSDKLRTRLELMLDRVRGSRPVAIGDSSTKSGAPPTEVPLTRQLDTLETLLADMEMTVSNLENYV